MKHSLIILVFEFYVLDELSALFTLTRDELGHHKVIKE